MPAEAPFGTRGSFEGFHFEEVSRKLFVLKLLHAVSGEAKWRELYQAELQARGGDKNLSKRALCAGGMVFWYSPRHNWTSCAAVGALRGLWELETDASLKAAYAAGLAASARLAAETLPLALQFDNADTSRFEMNWRVMNAEWRPQTTEQEAQAGPVEKLPEAGPAPQQGNRLRPRTHRRRLDRHALPGPGRRGAAARGGRTGHRPLRLRQALLLPVLLGRGRLGAPAGWVPVGAFARRRALAPQKWEI